LDQDSEALKMGLISIQTLAMSILSIMMVTSKNPSLANHFFNNFYYKWKYQAV